MDVTEDLKLKAQDWARKVVRLANTPVPPHMAEEKQKLLNYAKTVKTAIEKVFPSFGQAAELDQQLEFIPLLIGGVVAVAAAAIVKWTYDYNRFMHRLEEYKRLTNSGIPASQAVVIVDKLVPAKVGFKITAGMGALIPLVLVGGLGYYALRKN